MHDFDYENKVAHDNGFEDQAFTFRISSPTQHQYGHYGMQNQRSEYSSETESQDEYDAILGGISDPPSEIDRRLDAIPDPPLGSTEKHRLKNLDRIAGLKNTPPSFQIPVKCTFDYINSSSPLLQTKDSISPTTIQGSGQALGQSDVPSLSSPPANSPDATLKRLYVECFLAAAEKTAELEGKIKPVVRPVKGLPRTTDEMRGWIVEQARLAAAHRHAWKKLEEIENEKAEKQVRNEVQAKADLLVIVALNTVDEEGEEHREDSVNKDLE